MAMKRRNILLDQRTDRLLDRLAATHSGNPNLVVRHALRQYAATEAVFQRVESDPGFQRMMEKSDEDFKAGRFVRHEDVVRAVRRKNGQR
jgi:predicted transcriptional regulator